MAGQGKLREVDVPDDTLADRIRAALAETAVPVAEQRMFGGICFMVAGNMTACASQRGLLLRVGKDAQPAALARPHSRLMEMRGRVMAGYVFVSAEGVAADTDLRSWLKLAQSYVATLPPKQKSSPRRKPKNVPG